MTNFVSQESVAVMGSCVYTWDPITCILCVTCDTTGDRVGFIDSNNPNNGYVVSVKAGVPVCFTLTPGRSIDLFHYGTGGGFIETFECN